MPQGLILQLPSHAERLAAAEADAAKTSEPPVDIQASITAASSPATAAPAPPRAAAKRPPPPAWIVGSKARTLLLNAFGRVKAASDGHCTAFVRRDGALALLDPRGGMDDGDLVAWLDSNACELLVLAGSETDGSRWKAVFHPLAGAATLAIEPAADR